MKVSVALCTFNGEAYIGDQLMSIARQRVVPDEIVLCDDGSTDDTLEIVGTCVGLLPCPLTIRVNESTKGPIKNFEQAISACSGDIILLSDQDDVWSIDKIAEFTKQFHDNGDISYAFCDATISDECMRPLGSLWRATGFTGARFKAYSGADQLAALLSGGPFIYGNTLAVRESVRKFVIPFSECCPSVLGHDTWICLILAAMGYSGVAIPKQLVSYRQHGAQLAGAGRRRSWRGTLVRGFSAGGIDYSMRALAARSAMNHLRGMEVEIPRALLEYEAHFAQRGHLRGLKRWRRAGAVLKELKSGRYARYSSSFLSAAADIVSE